MPPTVSHYNTTSVPTPSFLWSLLNCRGSDVILSKIHKGLFWITALNLVACTWKMHSALKTWKNTFLNENLVGIVYNLKLLGKHLTMFYLISSLSPSLFSLHISFFFFPHLWPFSIPFFFFFPLSSMWVDEPGDPRFGHIHRLRSSKCPAVPDRCNAHSPSIHPEKWGWCAPHCLPAQPQPRRRELHLGCSSTCSNQWCLAHPRLRTALAEVHHLLWEWLWWVGSRVGWVGSVDGQMHIIYMPFVRKMILALSFRCSKPSLMSGGNQTAAEVKLY